MLTVRGSLLLAAETIADQKACVAELVEALTAQVQFAQLIADHMGIDMAETRLSVRVMPEGREVGVRSWADVQDAANVALQRARRVTT